MSFAVHPRHRLNCPFVRHAWSAACGFSLRDAEVAGSNPAFPTPKALARAPARSCLIGCAGTTASNTCYRAPVANHDREDRAFHKTMRREFLSATTFASIDDAQAQLDAWIQVSTTPRDRIRASAWRSPGTASGSLSPLRWNPMSRSWSSRVHAGACSGGDGDPAGRTQRAHQLRCGALPPPGYGLPARTCR